MGKDHEDDGYALCNVQLLLTSEVHRFLIKTTIHLIKHTYALFPYL